MHKYNVDFYSTVNARKHVGEIVIEAETAIEAVPLAINELNIDCRLFELQEIEIKIEKIY